jgi:hypothetical protein
MTCTPLMMMVSSSIMAAWQHGSIKERVGAAPPSSPQEMVGEVDETIDEARHGTCIWSRGSSTRDRRHNPRRMRSTPTNPTVSEILTGYNAVKRNRSLELTRNSTPSQQAAPLPRRATSKRPPVPGPSIPPKPVGSRNFSPRATENLYGMPSVPEDVPRQMYPTFAKTSSVDSLRISPVFNLPSPIRAPPPPPKTGGNVTLESNQQETRPYVAYFETQVTLMDPSTDAEQAVSSGIQHQPRKVV